MQQLLSLKEGQCCHEVTYQWHFGGTNFFKASSDFSDRYSYKRKADRTTFIKNSQKPVFEEARRLQLPIFVSHISLA
jgi:hypothetical protein